MTEQHITLWVMIVIVGLGTYALRLSFIVLSGRLKLPLAAERALRFVPVAALSAIILPELVFAGDTLDLSLSNARLVAGLCAALVAWFSRNLFLTIVVGMGVLWGLQWLSG